MSLIVLSSLCSVTLEEKAGALRQAELQVRPSALLCQMVLHPPGCLSRPCHPTACLPLSTGLDAQGPGGGPP